MSQNKQSQQEKEVEKLANIAIKSVKISSEINIGRINKLPINQRQHFIDLQNKAMNAIKDGDLNAVSSVMEEAKSIIDGRSN